MTDLAVTFVAHTDYQTGTVVERANRKTDQVPGGYSPGTSLVPGPIWLDAFNSRRGPSAYELVERYRGLIYALIAKNANAVVRIPIRLYADTSKSGGSARPGSASRSVATGGRPFESALPCPVTRSTFTRLLGLEYSRVAPASAHTTYEIRSHPFLTTMDNPDRLGYFDRGKLLSLICRYCDAVGSCYVFPAGPRGMPPSVLWPLYSQYVYSYRQPSSPLIGYFRYFADQIPFEDMIWFRLNDSLRDPYGSGYSPSYSGSMYQDLEERFISMQDQLLGLGARPNLVASPKDPTMPPGEPERLRFQADLARQFAGGMAGSTIVTNGAWDFMPISFSPADLAGLEVSKYNLERLCNIFGVPVASMTGETNLANSQAADKQHAKDAVEPRCHMIASTLTRIIRRYDDRLFFAFDAAVDADREQDARIFDMGLKNGSLTINEVLSESQYPPKPYGDEAWLSNSLQQPSMLQATHQMSLTAQAHTIDSGKAGDEASMGREEDDPIEEGDANPKDKSNGKASKFPSRGLPAEMMIDRALGRLETELRWMKQPNPYHGQKGDFKGTGSDLHKRVKGANKKKDVAARQKKKEIEAAKAQEEQSKLDNHRDSAARVAAEFGEDGSDLIEPLGSVHEWATFIEWAEQLDPEFEAVTLLAQDGECDDLPTLVEQLEAAIDADAPDEELTLPIATALMEACQANEDAGLLTVTMNGGEDEEGDIERSFDWGEERQFRSGHGGNPHHDSEGKFAATDGQAAGHAHVPKAAKNAKKRKRNRIAKGYEKKKAPPELKDTERSDRAKAAHKRTAKAEKDYAKANEHKFASDIGGKAYPDNAPQDVDVAINGKNHHLELKSLIQGEHGKIHMSSEALGRKVALSRKTGDPFHTVALDDRDVYNGGANKALHSGNRMYYRRGLGNYNVSTMHPVKDMDEMRRLIAMPTGQLPPKARGIIRK